MIVKTFSVTAEDRRANPKLFQDVILWSSNEQLMEKRASIDDLSEDVRSAVRQICPRSGHTYKLITVMGASEYYGQNRNGDIFYERALLLPGDTYGYRSFKRAGLFRHHVNKDAKVSLGEVLFAFYNLHMHRVELILDYDHAKLEQFGHMDYLDIAFPEYSMACRVPWDRCRQCNDEQKYLYALSLASSDIPEEQVKAVLAFHAKDPIRGLAKTRADYCEHAKYHMGEILPGGLQVGVINDFPKFFDISQVTSGADPTAKEMKKLASVRSTYAAMPSSSAWPVVSHNRSATMEKHAFYRTSGPEKLAAMIHEAEIDKRVDALGMPRHIAAEKPLSPSVLAHPDLVELLSTTGGAGIVLTPREFQRTVLERIGRSDLADMLDSEGRIFPPSDTIEDVPLSEAAVIPRLLEMLLPILDNRSCLRPVVSRRIVVIIKKIPSDFSDTLSAVQAPSDADIDKIPVNDADILRKLGSLYRGYRENLVGSIASLIGKALSHTKFANAVFDDIDDLSFYKTAGLPPNISGPAVAALASLFPLTYLYAAHLRSKERQGEQLGLLREFIAEHPLLSASALVGLLTSLGVHKRPERPGGAT